MKITIVLILSLCLWSIQAEEYLFVEESQKTVNKWTDFSSNSEFNVKRIINILAKSSKGKELIEKASKKARNQGETLFDVVQPGNGSITDSTLIRRFTPENPEIVVYENRSKVFINKDLNDFDAVLDLAHELTHFIYRKDFNPYVVNFNLKEFIQNTVEAEGGEVHAFMTECKVLRELYSQAVSSRYNCQKIYDPELGGFSFQKAKQEFYKVGPFFNDFKKSLSGHSISDHFPDLNDQTPSFISSAYRLPYPVAAFEEYQTVLKKVCENDLKRMSYLKAQSSRTPASVNQYEKFVSYYNSRCQSI